MVITHAGWNMASPRDTMVLQGAPGYICDLSNPGPFLQVIFSTQLKPLFPSQACSLDFKLSTKISNEFILKYQEPEMFTSKT